jgi:hypothetical protein
MYSIVFSPSIYTQYPMSRKVCKCITKINWNITFVFKPITQDFVEAPLAAITASTLLGYDATSLEQLYLGSISHFSLQILLSSVRLDGERHCKAIFRFLQRSPGSDWATQGRSETCPGATPVLSWLCAYGEPSLGGSNLLPFKNDRGHCSWGPSMLQTFFGTLPQICASTQSCLGALTDNSLDLMAFVLAQL